jgi:hypothetical protein
VYAVPNSLLVQANILKVKIRTKLPPLKLCPLPTRWFEGRRDVLDKMHTHFSHDIGKRHVSVLHGLGGGGKSQTAFKFVQESQDKKR